MVVMVVAREPGDRQEQPSSQFLTTSLSSSQMQRARMELQAERLGKSGSAHPSASEVERNAARSELRRDRTTSSAATPKSRNPLSPEDVERAAARAELRRGPIDSHAASPSPGESDHPPSLPENERAAARAELRRDRGVPSHAATKPVLSPEDKERAAARAELRRDRAGLEKARTEQGFSESEAQAARQEMRMGKRPY